jgi:hypothetical protein
LVGPDFYLGDPQTVAGYVGGSIGVLYGSGIDGDLVGGPEIGLIWNPINWKISFLVCWLGQFLANFLMAWRICVHSVGPQLRHLLSPCAISNHSESLTLFAQPGDLQIESDC